MTEEEPSESNGGEHTTPEKFRADMEVLRELGYETLSLERYYLGDYDRNKKYFILTFDDGYRSNYEVAFPILQEYGYYADIFINLASWDAQLLSAEQIREMEQSGLVKIYSHLYWHENSTEIPLARFEELLEDSYNKIAQYARKKRYKLFALPFGRYNRQTYQAARNRGVALQMIQWKQQFDEKDMCYRANVHYQSDLCQLIRKARWN